MMVGCNQVTEIGVLGLLFMSISMQLIYSGGPCSPCGFFIFDISGEDEMIFVSSTWRRVDAEEYLLKSGEELRRKWT